MRSLCALAFVLLASGCAGGGQDALRKEIEVLRQEVGRVRANNNILAARVETLELTNAKRAARPPAAAVSAPKSAEDDRPSLDVVHLAPTAEGGTAASLAPIASAPTDDDPGGANEPDDTPRPVLRSTARGEVITQPAAPAPASLAKAKRPLPSTPRTAP
ncbi:hypothetical protein [Polyangium mundeleinium]|uniref:Uncharacterized protein n=1 Tax=Polyangium mundeleinium TaxID=2995306 RepID=A0ABT5ELK4_9BACT|nr:hypothetical protein [Polyangium mundeleinium]MDC0742344.1 hypothetical protein [Polyangium mundeleinium]